MRVAKAGVVGAGTMGAAIAEVLALNGIDVVLKDVDAALRGVRVPAAIAPTAAGLEGIAERVLRKGASR